MRMHNPEYYLKSICRFEARAELQSLRIGAAKQSSGRRAGRRGQGMPWLGELCFVGLSLVV